MMAAGEPRVRRSAPAALRNREPIAEVLREWLPKRGTVLEVASGTGEHAVYFAARFPGLNWQPTDPDSSALSSIAAWREEAALANLAPPFALDAAGEWGDVEASAILCINMAHISPWEATLGLLRNAQRILGPGDPLIFYGPWLAQDVQTAASNLEFDASLRSRDSRWGIRSVEALAGAAIDHDFKIEQRRAMPANNFMLLLKRVPDLR